MNATPLGFALKSRRSRDRIAGTLVRSHSQNLNAKRLLVVDEHPLIREGLRALVNREPDFRVVWEAGSVKEALGTLERCMPDAMILGLTFPDGSGLALVKEIHECHPELPMLVVSAYEEELFAERVLRAGGRGFISKREEPARLLNAIRAICAGEIFLAARATGRILAHISHSRADLPPALLTDREFEVFELLGAGYSTKEIACLIRVSPKTAEAHRVRIKCKLGVSTASALVAYAARWRTSRAPKSRAGEEEKP